jgi:hypothetical protein
VAYFNWFIGQVNAAFAKLFGASPPVPGPVTDPTTDDATLSMLQAKIGAMKLTLVNGVPVLA